MSKNIVICCDGTGNEVGANLSNVLKLFRVAQKNSQQIVFYDPGVGTLGSSDPWSQFKSKFRMVFGLATGYGLDQNVLDVYCFLIDNFEEGDSVFVFGFSRGAYTARVVTGFLRLVGLVNRSQRNLADYALTAYKKAAEENDLEIAWRFERVISTRRVPVKFIGVWDTVSSVIVPRPDRLYVPSLQELPYTKTNSYVAVFRHALAIDERRRMFRANLWKEPQRFKPNPFAKDEGSPQDVKQVWFAGVHSDVGGGYAEEESGLAKYPLRWIIDEAMANGLLVNKGMYDHLVLGLPRTGSTRSYTPPDATAQLHRSLTAGWNVLEWLPKRAKRKEWIGRASALGWYLPQGEPRPVPVGSRIHSSVLERIKGVPGYRPPNLPTTDQYVVEP